MVSQTPSGALQSALLLHGSDMHMPTVPSVAVQYWPVEQFGGPPSSCRQPVVQTPVEVVDVSQYEPARQSVSAAHPHTAKFGMQIGVVGSRTQIELFEAEHVRHWPAAPDPAGWQAGAVALGHASGPGFMDE